jgi:glucose-6-phosphate 1-dehydrogenase
MTTDSKTTMSVPPAKPAGSCAMVIFGAGGDLTKRLVVPALYNLATSGLLPKEFALIGVDIADFTTDQWRQHLTDMMQSFLAGGGEFQPELIDTDTWNSLLARTTYLRGDFGQGTAKAASAGALGESAGRCGGAAAVLLIDRAAASRSRPPDTVRS